MADLAAFINGNKDTGGDVVVDGKDGVYGHTGNDVVKGGADGDILSGGAEDDRLYANTQVSVAAAIAAGNDQTDSGPKGDWLADGGRQAWGLRKAANDSHLENGGMKFKQRKHGAIRLTPIAPYCVNFTLTPIISLFKTCITKSFAAQFYTTLWTSLCSANGSLDQEKFKKWDSSLDQKNDVVFQTK